MLKKWGAKLPWIVEVGMGWKVIGVVMCFGGLFWRGFALYR
jgi:hypothetical protein